MNTLEGVQLTQKIYVEACRLAFKQSLEELNNTLKLNVPISADLQTGYNYGEIH